MTGDGPLARVVQTCTACPSQWSAWTTNGTELYMRYRGGRGRVELGDGTRLSAPVLAEWDDHDYLGGYITLEDFMTKAELTLADGADVVPAEDPDHTGPESLQPARTAAAAAPAHPSPAAAAPPTPTPFLQGTFALYMTPGGGAVLAYRAKGSSDDKQLMIPPFILQTAANASGISPDEILSRIQSGTIDG